MSTAELERLLAVPYRDHGRDMSGMDCWGQVRWALHRLFGKPLLPSHAEIRPDDRPALGIGYLDVARLFKRTLSPQPGDVMAGYSGPAMTHVGLCVEADGRLMVLHTRRAHGARLDRIAALQRVFSKIVWWRYAGD